MNRKHHPALAMAVAAVTGLGLTAFTVTAQDQTGSLQERQDRTQQDRIQQDRAQQAQQIERPQLPQGIEEKDDPDIEGFRGTLRDLTNAAFTDGGFDDMVERFVDQDRNRFGEWIGDNDFDELDDAVEKLRTAFEEKYGEELDLDPEKAFARLQAVQGEVKNPEQVAGNWPVQATEGAMGASPEDRARLAGERQGAEGAREGGTDETKREHRSVIDSQEDSNIEEGRDVAVVAIPGPEGKPALRASMVNEFPGTWKLDVPNEQNGETAYRTLTQRMEKLATSTDKWPESADQAEQWLAYEVLASLYGVDAEKQGQEGHTPDRLDREDGMPERDSQRQGSSIPR